VTDSEILATTLARLGLDAHAEALAGYATVELGLVHTEDLTGSRIGGLPELPAGFAWPHRRWPLVDVALWPDWAQHNLDEARALGQVTYDGDELVMPIPFLLQLDLATIGDPRLPDRGLLAVFVAVTSTVDDPELAMRVDAAVVHFPDRAACLPRKHPPTVDRPPSTAIGLRAEPRIAWDIPYEDREALVAALPPAGFAALMEEERLLIHALFGAPAEENAGPMPPEGSVLLLRVHEDDDAEFGVGDASWVSFVIKPADLRAGRFANVRASVFCG
jgi:hypothetical protein